MTKLKLTQPPKFPRRAGILLHLTSLPGPGGIGSMGLEAREFIDFLAESGQTLWQMLPLNPVGYGNAPYSSPSAFACNPLVISLEDLRAEGLLSLKDLRPAPVFSEKRVNYDLVGDYREKLLVRAWKNFLQAADSRQMSDFEKFKSASSYWLSDYALYLALKRRYKGAPWFDWPTDLLRRRPGAIRQAREEMAPVIAAREFFQYLFHRQWRRLRDYARTRKVKIIGDIPIYVNYDSVDAWVLRNFFYLNAQGKRTELSGVPPANPDAPSQIWGNPLYKWNKMRHAGFPWWTERFSNISGLVDIVRIDHFTGFRACWHIPPKSGSSSIGRWVQGPGVGLFQHLENTLGPLNIIAEDLGPIHEQVDILLAQTGFPSTRILQYAFNYENTEVNRHYPPNYPHNCAAYTGTHDHNTIVGWYAGMNAAQRARFHKFIGVSPRDKIAEVNWASIKSVFSSPADTAIIPLQDVLGLGSEARMNIPGTSKGQWEWRCLPGMLNSNLAQRLKAQTVSTDRLPS